MCYVTATEFKKNLSHYMLLSQKEDVCITKNKRVITMLTCPQKAALYNLAQLRVLYPMDDTGEDYKDIAGKEIAQKCGF